MGGPAPHPLPDEAVPRADLPTTLHARGMRMTPQRERVLAAVRMLGHATPDAVAEAVDADGGPPLPLSTVYRNLEALEQVGVVRHTHLDHRAPTYHLATAADHLHLKCLGCQDVAEAPVALAEDFAVRLRERLGFLADLRHMAIHGWCQACLDASGGTDAAPGQASSADTAQAAGRVLPDDTSQTP